MYQEIITAFLLGLVGGVIPGPVLAATFTEILQSGFYKSLRIIFWAMLAEASVALISLLVLSSLGLSEYFFNTLSLIGACILIWIAISIWKIRSINTGEKVYFSPWKIATMIIANGVLWTFWITVCIPKAIALGQLIPFGGFIFLIFVEIGWLVSTTGVAFVFSWFRGLLSKPHVTPIMFKIFSLLFFYFAINMIFTSIIFFSS